MSMLGLGGGGWGRWAMQEYCEVNDSDIPMEPLRYPVMAQPCGELTALSACSADGLRSVRRKCLHRHRVEIDHKHLSNP